MLVLREIEAERGVGHDITTLGCSTYSAPQVAMYVHDLVSLFEPAVLAPKEAIPVAYGSSINVAIRPAAGIQRYFVRATGVTDERRTVTRRGSGGRDKCIPARVFIPAICVQIKAAGAVIYQPSNFFLAKGISAPKPTP